MTVRTTNQIHNGVKYVVNAQEMTVSAEEFVEHRAVVGRVHHEPILSAGFGNGKKKWLKTHKNIYTSFPHEPNRGRCTKNSRVNIFF